MFPPPLAHFSFHDDSAGRCASLAARFSSVTAEYPVLLLGADRTELVRTLARLTDALIVVDPSRASLRAARTACAADDGADRITYLAADPRDLDVPGGCRAVLIPSLAWRALVSPLEREEMLRCLRRSLEPGGYLCVDLERIPLLDEGNGRARRTPEQDVELSIDDGSGLTLPLTLTGQTVEAALDEVRAAGFEIQTARSAATGAPLGDSTKRLWAVARAPGDGAGRTSP